MDPRDPCDGPEGPQTMAPNRATRQQQGVTMAQPKDVTDATFSDEVLKADKPTVVDYWADWCGPCKQLSPILDQLAEEYGDKINFVKVDADANTKVATDQGILGLPTVQIYQNGEVVKQFQGGKPKSVIVKMLQEFV